MASTCGEGAWPPCKSREALPVTGRVLHLCVALQVLKDVAEAKVRDLDMWQITLACNVEQQKAEDLPDDKLTQPQQVRAGVRRSSSMEDEHRCWCGSEFMVRMCSLCGQSEVSFQAQLEDLKPCAGGIGGWGARA